MLLSPRIIMTNINAMSFNNNRASDREVEQKSSPRQRDVVVQRYFLQMGAKEMAEINGLAPGTVKWMLNAARKRLRRLLAEQE